MSTLFVFCTHKEDSSAHLTHIDITADNNNTHTRCASRPKHNFKLRSKCRQALRRKLKKYKLRKDGKEDPEILDVSEILVTSLRVKSPQKTKLHVNSDSEIEVPKPKNYLFKMARRKQKLRPENSESAVKSPQDAEKSQTSPVSVVQEKKHTNAFKLMMDSRNKSIGTNSPGKEKSLDSPHVEEILEKKAIKAKRNLALQKMAKAKGVQRKKELEEYQEKCINDKMEKRAERLKKLINNAKVSKTVEVNNKDVNAKEDIKVDDKNVKTVPIVNVKKPATKKLVDIFGVLKDCPDKKIVPNEDEEFLKKLAPSLKKKENMLCYFSKIDKPTNDVSIPEKDISPILKVKFNTKNNKRKKKRKLSLKKDDANEVLKDHNGNKPGVSDSESEECDLERKAYDTSEKRKRKRKENGDIELLKNTKIVNSIDSTESDQTRPKRNIRRPVKYSDDVQFTSSDDELHIFTPKKKRNVDNEKSAANKVINLDNDSNEKIAPKSKKIEVESKQPKKPTKLAPIFATKPQLSQEQLEARQKFLFSGVPDQLKKIIAQQKNVESEYSNCFPVVLHVQQSYNAVPSESTLLVKNWHIVDSSDDEVIEDKKKSLFQSLLSSRNLQNACDNIPMKRISVSTVLQNIKELYPKFPVYRTYRLLKRKRKVGIQETDLDINNSKELINDLTEIMNDDPEYLNWTDKYRPTSTKHLIGNFESIKELKRWLETWTENSVKSKKSESDSSEFYDSDSNSRDGMRSANNLLVLTGPVGSGKTSSVYAVAAELAMKVIEVNASSKRTGKLMLQDLQEATQSHKVNRGGIDNSQKSQEVVDVFVLKTNKRKGRPKKLSNVKAKIVEKKEVLSPSSSSQETGRTAMSLILIDDADIVFDQDDGFVSAITQIVQSSKRPVILVTSSLSCPHLQKFLQCRKIIKMRPFSPKILGTWLDIMCLADNKICRPGLGATYLNYFKGDIRKTINSLQFHLSSQGLTTDEPTSQNSDLKSSTEDEHSNNSWADSENVDEKILMPIDDNENEICRSILQSNLFGITSPTKLIEQWWSVPDLMKETFVNSCPSPEIRQKPTLELDSVANIIDALSTSDYLTHITQDSKSDITSEPWYTNESDSVSENESMDYFDKHNETLSDIAHNLVTGSFFQAQKVLKVEKRTNLRYPDMAAQRQKDSIVSRHEFLTSILNPSVALDRRALALDYWSTCRSICRIEKTKTDTVFKRHNRFCHYLKTLNVLCRNESLDKLAESLDCSSKHE